LQLPYPPEIEVALLLYLGLLFM